MFELATAFSALFSASIFLAHAVEAYQAPQPDIDQPAFGHSARSSIGMPAAQAKSASSARDGGPTLAEDIARWLVELHYEDLPAHVVTTAKRVTLDTLGCALGALDAEPVGAARKVIALQGGNPQATIVGVGGKAACD